MSVLSMEGVPLVDRKNTEDKIREAVNKAYARIDSCIVSAVTSTVDLKIVNSYKNSQSIIGGYASLNWEHLADIRRLEKTIARYVADTKLDRPLNVVMHSEPGSGKTHFVKCLARLLKELNADQAMVDMTAVKGMDDMLGAIDDVRSLRADGKFPILFIDEFDADPANYALLLPLLWDGKVTAQGRTLNTGKLVIILAGSKPEIAKAMKSARNISGKKSGGITKTKLPDLVSRINGGELQVPALEERRVDKVCLTLARLSIRFENLKKVPWALLKFAAETEFRHGVRSITNLVETIDRCSLINGTLDLASVKWPLDDLHELNASHLPLHLMHKDGAEGLVDRWKELKKNPHVVEFIDDPADMDRLIEGSARFFATLVKSFF